MAIHWSLTAATAINPTMRSLIVLLIVVVGMLLCAIYVAASSTGRSRNEANLAAAQTQVEEARADAAAERIETLEREDADLKKQLDRAKANLDRQAEKLAAAEQEALRLRGDLDKALKEVAELNQKYVDALDAQRKAKLDADALKAEALKKDAAGPVVKAPAANVEGLHAGNNQRGQKKRQATRPGRLAAQNHPKLQRIGHEPRRSIVVRRVQGWIPRRHGAGIQSPRH